MLVVTTGEVHGWDIQRVCGEVIGTAVRDRVTPGADAEQALTDSRNEVVSRMLEHARTKGANVVVGLRFDSTGLGDGASEVCAYGTAVVAVPVDDGARQTATALGYGQPGGGAASPQAEPEQQYAQQQYDQPAYGQPQYGGQPQYDPNQQYPGQAYPGQQQHPGQQHYPGQQQYPGQPGYPQHPPHQGYPQQ